MTDDPKAIELMPCCAHLTLRYQTKPVPDSIAVTGAWHCKDCDTEFNITRASHPRNDNWLSKEADDVTAQAEKFAAKNGLVFKKLDNHAEFEKDVKLYDSGFYTFRELQFFLNGFDHGSNLRNEADGLKYALQIARRDIGNWITQEDARDDAIAHIDKYLKIKAGGD